MSADGIFVNRISADGIFINGISVDKISTNGISVDGISADRISAGCKEGKWRRRKYLVLVVTARLSSIEVELWSLL